jgi:Zn-dependent M28 family amino/carboxypeptidase
VQLLGAPVIALLVAAAILRRRRLVAVAGPAAATYGALLAFLNAGGALLPQRSHGALDDGAACAVLIRVADELAALPPARTEVVVALFSGEELGAQGSRAWVRDRLGGGAELPTSAVNLELIGSSNGFLAGGEWSLLRLHAPPESLLELVGSAVRHVGGDLHVSRLGGVTDAVAFRERGIAAVTLVGREGRWLLPRGMHGPSDRRERVREDALDVSRALVRELVRRVDAQG